MQRPTVATPLCLLVLVVAACASGYEDENRSIVAELPVIDGVGLVETDHYGYCTGDSCPFGNDRSGALLTYSVDADRFTQEGLAEEYRDALPGWDPTIETFCANADPSFCDELVSARFTNGTEEITLNLDNWPVGRFDLHVDARGNE